MSVERRNYLFREALLFLQESARPLTRRQIYAGLASRVELTEAEKRISRKDRNLALYEMNCGYDLSNVGKRLGWVLHDPAERTSALTAAGVEALQWPAEKMYAAMNEARKNGRAV
ncbi:hypothetical protein [Cryptosporangium japonicum]|uniref:WYL domain-containing protein n=1 Tax=Cryptosporangium japonicum TaxID=80872 RepID=A0ABN0V5J7_9ACTN